MVMWLDSVSRVSKEILLLMRKELLISLFSVRDLRYRPVQLLSVLIAAIFDLLLLLRTQRVVNFFGDLEFEIDGDMRTGTGRSGRISRRVVVIR